ncbi:MAG: Rpn family recombination-promoting nuclease/putative transposase [Prevotella sp.]|nr:Rpn family recombination-promoting nuclease/putative transposase [Prevotella sp.]
MRDKPYISFDWALKRLLRDKANFDVLEGFLTTLLCQTIKIHRLLESEGNKDRDDSKMNRVDILAENDKGELLLIEVQGESEFAYFQRILFGTSKLVTEYINGGENYENVKKVYSVNIVYFDLGQGKDFVYHGKTEFRGIHENDVLRLSPFQQQKFGVDEVYKLYPEYYILKVNDFNRWSKVPLEQWIYFLANSDIPEDADAPGLREAREKLLFSQMSREEQLAYRRYIDDRVILNDQIYTAKGEGRLEGIAEGRAEGFKEGVEQGIEQGIEQGERKANESMARKLKSMGVLSVEQIAETTGLPVEEIVRL